MFLKGFFNLQTPDTKLRVTTHKQRFGHVNATNRNSYLNIILGFKNLQKPRFLKPTSTALINTRRAEELGLITHADLTYNKQAAFLSNTVRLRYYGDSVLRARWNSAACGQLQFRIRRARRRSHTSQPIATIPYRRARSCRTADTGIRSIDQY